MTRADMVELALGGTRIYAICGDTGVEGWLSATRGSIPGFARLTVAGVPVSAADITLANGFIVR